MCTLCVQSKGKFLRPGYRQINFFCLMLFVGPDVSERSVLYPGDALVAQAAYIKASKLVNWRCEPSQPLGTISGLKETFMKRYIVERTNKAEMKPEEQS